MISSIPSNWIFLSINEYHHPISYNHVSYPCLTKSNLSETVFDVYRILFWCFYLAFVLVYFYVFLMIYLVSYYSTTLNPIFSISLISLRFPLNNFRNTVLFVVWRLPNRPQQYPYFHPTLRQMYYTM